MFQIPLLGAFLDAAGTIMYKKLANRHKIGYKDFMVYGFLSIVLVSLPLLYFFWRIDPLAGRNMNIAILFLVVVISIFANYFSFYAFKHRDLSKIQSIRLTAPLFTILLAFLLSFFFEAYANERNYYILLFAFIASLSLFFSNIKKHHLKFDKYSWAMLFGSFLFAVELTISKPILEFYHPITFYFIRSLFILVISYALFRGSLSNLKPAGKGLFLASAVFWVAYRGILYYAYGIFGIVFTTTVFILSPVLIYICSFIFLKEKVTKAQVISSMVIVACVLGAVWVGN
jgi:drug/metabolite transporter (DMT)-like permease